MYTLQNDQGKMYFLLYACGTGDKWNVIDGVVSYGSLEPELQKVITNLEASGNSAIQYALFGPAGTSQLTFTTSYALLEREFFIKDNGKLYIFIGTVFFLQEIQ